MEKGSQAILGTGSHGDTQTTYWGVKKNHKLGAVILGQSLTLKSAAKIPC